jgi:glycosyltransferase involved in cell wall biosynthesis
VRYSIIGYSTIPKDLQSVGVVETGRYRTAEDCMATIEALAPDFAFLPSIWPETYCFALSIALHLGLPPLVFDLGAQAERVGKAGFGVVFDTSLIHNPSALNDAILGLSVNDEWRKRRPVAFRKYDAVLPEYYGLRDAQPS